MALPERLHSALAEGLAGLLVTVGPDGYPHAAFTWAAAPTREHVRAIADWPSTTLANVQANPRVSVQIIGPDELLFLLKGAARVRGYHEISPQLRIAVVEMRVEHVKDQSWPVVRVAPLRYAWTDPGMAAVERAVLQVLKERADPRGP